MQQNEIADALHRFLLETHTPGKCPYYFISNVLPIIIILPECHEELDEQVDEDIDDDDPVKPLITSTN